MKRRLLSALFLFVLTAPGCRYVRPTVGLEFGRERNRRDRGCEVPVRETTPRAAPPARER